IVRVQSELRGDLRFADAATVRTMLAGLLTSPPYPPSQTAMTPPPPGPPDLPGSLPGLPPASVPSNGPPIPPPDLPFPGQERIAPTQPRAPAGGGDLGALITGPPEGPSTVSGLRAGGPAAKAGLRVGDIVLGIQGVPLSKPADFPSLIRRFKPG